MSEENVSKVREGFDSFASTGQLAPDVNSPGFVWDMSNFDGWPEQQVYNGPDEVRGFLETWTSTWDDWRLELDALLDAGDKVVALVRQSGTSKTSRLPIEMSFAMVWTLVDGEQTRMDMYSDRTVAIEAAGLSK